jgi:hypothetical protein
MLKIKLIVLCLLFSLPAFGAWKDEEIKVNYLLQEISKVEGVFIRNGTAYPPNKAVEHLRMKMKNALNSWFTPKKDKWTVKMFIDKIASKSSMSGDPYQIRLKNGKTTNAGVWLHRKLKLYSKQP